MHSSDESADFVINSDTYLFNEDSPVIDDDDIETDLHSIYSSEVETADGSSDESTIISTSADNSAITDTDISSETIKTTTAATTSTAKDKTSKATTTTKNKTTTKPHTTTTSVLAYVGDYP